MTRFSGSDPRLLFVVTTALEDPRVVDQLVSMLAPHQVVIRHDFSARAEPGFRPARNLTMAPGLGHAGWGVWSFVEAIRDTMRHCLRHHDFDYLQMLSGSCLPIHPIREFQRHIGRSPADIHLDSFDLRDERGAVHGYAYRLLADRDTFAFRALRKLRQTYLGGDALRRPVVGLEVPVPDGARWLAALEPMLVAAMRWQGRIGSNAPQLDPVVGSNWFGLRRDACAFLARRLSEPRVIRHFMGRMLPEEHALPAVLAASPFRIGPSNHLINEFDPQGHPVRFELDDLPRIAASSRWFARKFPDHVDAPIRSAIAGIVRGEVQFPVRSVA